MLAVSELAVRLPATDALGKVLPPDDEPRKALPPPSAAMLKAVLKPTVSMPITPLKGPPLALKLTVGTAPL